MIPTPVGALTSQRRELLTTAVGINSKEIHGQRGHTCARSDATKGHKMPWIGLNVNAWCGTSHAIHSHRALGGIAVSTRRRGWSGGNGQGFLLPGSHCRLRESAAVLASVGK